MIQFKRKGRGIANCKIIAGSRTMQRIHGSHFGRVVVVIDKPRTAAVGHDTLQQWVAVPSAVMKYGMFRQSEETVLK